MLYSKAVCSDLPPFANGMITYTVNEIPRPIRTVASYACDDGYVLNGERTRECVDVGGIGEFSRNAPTCQRKFNKYCPTIQNHSMISSSDIKCDMPFVFWQLCVTSYQLSLIHI